MKNNQWYEKRDLRCTLCSKPFVTLHAMACHYGKKHIEQFSEFKKEAGEIMENEKPVEGAIRKCPKCCELFLGDDCPLCVREGAYGSP